MQTPLAKATALKPPAVRRAARRLNDLSATEWVRETISVWTQKGLGKNHPHAAIERQHPAPFSFQDIARVIQFFTKAGETVLDPFVGVGSTLKAAALTGRNGVGIDLNHEYVALAKQRLEQEVPDKIRGQTRQEVICGDARTTLSELADIEVPLVVTSPPYWNILRKVDHKASQERIEHGLSHHYGDDPGDLGNISSYEVFVNELADCLGQCRGVMTARAHLCVVVSDFRHKSRYYMFHADLSRSLQERGFTTKGVIVLHQPKKRVFPYGYPTAFVPNVHHQYILICQRDDSGG